MGSEWIIVIDASGSGGFESSRHLIEEIPQDIDAVVLIALHRPRDHPSELWKSFAASCAMPIVIANEGCRLVPGVAHVGDPGVLLRLVEKQFSLKRKREPQNGGDPTVELLFRSVADAGRQHTVAVVLADVLAHSRGLAAIRQAGGSAMVMCSLSFREQERFESTTISGELMTVVGNGKALATAIRHLISSQA